MYVSELYIMNYKSIKKEKIKFNQGRNVLVGKNNAGKSNIVKALDILLGEKHPNYIEIEERDFFCKQDKGKEIYEDFFFLAVKLEGNDFNKDVLKNAGYYCVVEIYEDNPINRFYETGKLCDEGLYTKLFKNMLEKKYYRGNEIIDFIDNISEIYIYFYVDKNNINEDENIKYEKTYNILVKSRNKYCRMTANKELKDNFITCAVLPAFRDPQNQFRINSWSWYGKLIKNIWETGNQEIKNEIMEQLKQLKQKTEEIFKGAVLDLEEKLKNAIYNTEISFQLIQNTKDDVYKGINIFLNDGINTPIYDKGSGIQSALAISLFSYYCSRFHKNSSLLIVEEPEIYLHPQARRALSQRFDEFVNMFKNEGIQNQVIITTHSTEFIKNTPLENIIIVRKQSNEQTTISRINTDRDIRELQKIKNMIWNISSEMFFADEVILVEGGEFYLLPLIADKLLDEKRSLEKRNISVVKVEGKDYFKPYIELLKDLNINYYVIADFDVLEKVIEQFKDFISQNLRQKMNEIKKIISDIKKKENENINYDGIKKVCTDKNSLDAETFYKIVEKICLNKKYDDSLKSIWEYIKSRKQIKVNGECLKKYPEEAEKIYQFINELKEDNIFILKEGELEDYITEQGNSLAREFDLAKQKELKIIKFAEMIENGEKELEDIFNIDEYKSFLKYILINKKTNSEKFIEEIVYDNMHIIEQNIINYIENTNVIKENIYEDFNKVEFLEWDDEIKINKIFSENIDNNTLIYYVDFSTGKIKLNLYKELEEGDNLKVGTVICKVNGKINIQTQKEYNNEISEIIREVCETFSIVEININLIKFIDINGICIKSYNEIYNNYGIYEECAKDLID